MSKVEYYERFRRRGVPALLAWTLSCLIDLEQDLSVALLRASAEEQSVSRDEAIEIGDTIADLRCRAYWLATDDQRDAYRLW